MIEGDLVLFTDNCTATMHICSLKIENESQIPLFPNATINAGEIGLLLKDQYFYEVGSLCQVLIGKDIFFDIPKTAIKKLTAAFVERNAS